MENIEKWFKNDKDNTYRIDKDESHLYVNTKSVIYLIVAPHAGTDNKYMLRVAPAASFDRWANSVVIQEFFDDEMSLCDYLEKNQVHIYQELLEALSEDYYELYRLKD